MTTGCGWKPHGQTMAGCGAGSSVQWALYLPGSGGTVFGSRQVWGLRYRSQRASAEHRAVERSVKARERLGVTDQNMLDMPYCPRPKWPGACR